MSKQAPPPRREPVFQTRIFIERDGTVVFENLAEELLPLARELDPDGTIGLVCRTAPAEEPPEEHPDLAEESDDDG